MKSLTVYLSAIAFLVVSVITVYGAENVKVDAKALFEQKRFEKLIRKGGAEENTSLIRSLL